MKATDPLIRTLQVWRVNPPPDATFRTEVWKRIEERRGGAWRNWKRTPVLGASAALLATVVLAGWIGHAVGRAQMRDDREILLATYTASLDARVQNGLGGQNR